MTEVYIVTSEEYSDYGIVTVFLDKAKAEKFVGLYGGELETYDTTDDLKLENAVLGDAYEVTLFDEEREKESWVYGGKDNDGNPRYAIEALKATYYIYNDAHTCLYLRIYVFAKNERHALAQAKEKMLFLKSNGLWKVKEVTK